MKARIAVAGALLAASWAAGAAEITATATLASEYDFRGITQTQGEPAFQLGLNYGAESGIYMGVWGSNVKFGNTEEWQIYGRRPSTEIDLYMGYAGGDAEETFGWDLGAIYYSYPNGTGGNTPEVYAGVSKGVGSLKLWYSWDYAGSGDTAYYVDLNLTLPMANNFSFLVHGGYSGAEYHVNRWGRTGGLGEYLDWSMGVALDAGGWTSAIKYVDGSDLNSNPRNLGRFVFSISTTLGGDEE
jgi:uncharacterized protein (TIGR02001 family)